MTRQTPSSTSVRPHRQPLSKRNRVKIAIPEADGYAYRLANKQGDNGQRVDILMEQGYEIAPSNKAVHEGDRRVDTASPIGSNDISLGRGDRGVLMRIKDEYHQEDVAYKNSLADEQESIMKDTAKQAADFGGLSINITK